MKMKWLLIIQISLLGNFSYGAETIYPQDAGIYLEKMNCIFSAYAKYTGKDAGILKNGQAYSNSLCASSYEDGGAKKHSFCWLRVVNLKEGVYVGRASYGDAWRDESGPCSKESLTKILSKGAIKSQILFGANKEWKVVTDKTDIASDFYKLFSKSNK